MSSEIDQAIAKGSLLVATLGALMMLAGLAAVVIPLVIPQAIATILGWVFLVGGVIRLVQAFQSPGEEGLGLEVAIACLYVLVALLIFIPIIGNVVGLRPALAATLMLEGVLEVILAYRFRVSSPRNWVVFSGTTSIVLGILIGAGATLTAIWLLGLLVGISLFVTGLWFIMLARTIGGESNSEE